MESSAHTTPTEKKPFDPRKRYRKSIDMDQDLGQTGSIEAFFKQAYNNQAFRFIPGTSFLNFSTSPSWFPEDSDLEAKSKMGRRLYDLLAARNSFIENFGVRFFFTNDKTNNKFLIEQQVMPSAGFKWESSRTPSAKTQSPETSISQTPSAKTPIPKTPSPQTPSPKMSSSKTPSPKAGGTTTGCTKACCSKA